MSGIQNASPNDDDDDDVSIAHARILRASLSAAVQNAAGPIGLAAQHAMLGKRSSTALAAFGVCVNVSNLGTTVFQFVSLGSTAKVGASVAKREGKAVVRRHVRESFCTSVLAGVAAGGALLLSRDTLFSALGDGEALRAGRGYYAWRCMSIPFKTSSNASIGVLGGYGYVHVVSVMNSVVAVLQVSMVGVVLRACSGKREDEVLDRLGLAYFAVIVFHAMVGWAIVHFNPPKEIGLERRGKRRETTESEYEEKSKKDFEDALNMFARSVLLQSSFFIAVIVASRKLPIEGLAGHHLTAQLWLVCSYIVDGFATIGTIYGSRLYSIKCIKKMRVLTVRLLSYGVSLGLLFCVTFLSLGATGRKLIAGTDERTNFYLEKTWTIVSFAQPVNALVFVLDGLMYATKSYAFARDVMVAGVGLVYLPAILSATLIVDGKPGSGPKVIARIWIAKLALNVWRMFFLSGRVFFWILKEEDRCGENDDDDDDDERDTSGSEISDEEDIEESMIDSDDDDHTPLLSL